MTLGICARMVDTGISESVETQVEIISLTGEIVYAERIRCGGDCGTHLMNVNEVLDPGVYMVI